LQNLLYVFIFGLKNTHKKAHIKWASSGIFYFLMWTPTIKNGSSITCVYYCCFTALPVAFLPRLKMTILASRISLAQGGAILLAKKAIVQ